ncbi:hypothetical protein BSKO_08826 [Bryopsis sp. KO-2023]|nr:hypothetical protein BSKO_07762 [Bryopsis sp. KO-2023]GMH40922.1 hypothetical protein BSKO_08826 [Bryopsis sp. KO-2023]
MLAGEKEGYKILDPPQGYQPIRTPARKVTATPTPIGGTPLYSIPEDNVLGRSDVPATPEGLPEMKPEDLQHFGVLLQEINEGDLNSEDFKERKIMKLLLQVKNGSPPQRKSALSQLPDKSR